MVTILESNCLKVRTEFMSILPSQGDKGNEPQTGCTAMEEPGAGGAPALWTLLWDAVERLAFSIFTNRFV